MNNNSFTPQQQPPQSAAQSQLQIPAGLNSSNLASQMDYKQSGRSRSSISQNAPDQRSFNQTTMMSRNRLTPTATSTTNAATQRGYPQNSTLPSQFLTTASSGMPHDAGGLLMSGNVLGKRKLRDLVMQVDSEAVLLLELADEFIESVTTFACKLAKHRRSDTLDVKDLQLHLEHNWNIRVPGFVGDEVRYQRRPTTVSAHQTRLKLIAERYKKAAD